MSEVRSDNPATKMQRAAGRLFLVVGVGLLIVSASSGISTARFLHGSSIAQGSVIAIVDEQDAEGDFSLRPRIVFETAEGQRAEFESRQRSNRSPYRVHDLVEVVYDPYRPTHAEINTVFNLWSVSIISFLVGASFVGVAVALHAQSKRL
ncbi:MAG: DUF3592 domain-containing protein [Planctomycetaceae bacterium]